MRLMLIIFFSSAHRSLRKIIAKEGASLKAHIIWYRSRPSESITARLRGALFKFGCDNFSEDITIRPELVPAMLAKALPKNEIIVIVGGMDQKSENENIIFVLAKCLSLELEKGKKSRSKYIFNPLQSKNLPSIDDSILFPSQGGGPEGAVLSSDEQTIIVLPWMDGRQLDIIDSISLYLPNIIKTPDEEEKIKEVKAVSSELPEYIEKAVEKHYRKRVASDVELSRYKLRRMFSNSFLRDEATETNISRTNQFDNMASEVTEAPRFFSTPRNTVLSSHGKWQPFFRVAAIVTLLTVIALSCIAAKYYETGLIAAPVKYQSELSSMYNSEKKSENLPTGALPEFSELYSINNEVRGYLSIPGTGLSQPIMYSVTDAPDKYSSLDFYGQPNERGSLYFDIGNTIEPNAYNYNLVVYGSAPSDGSLFTELQGYMDKKYLSEHPLINLDTLYERAQWRVFSVCIVSGDTVGEFNYCDTEFNGDYDHQIHLYNLYIRSLFYTATEVFPDEKIITLVTDCNEFNGAKLLVCARKVRESEDLSTAGSYVVENDRVMMPDVWYASNHAKKPAVPSLSLPTESVIVTEEEPLVVLRTSAPTTTTTTASAKTTTTASTAKTTTAVTATPTAAASTTAATAATTAAPNPTTLPGSAASKTMRINNGSKIIEGSITDILAKIVEAEMGSSYNMEALKAQAVAAYTFYLYNGGEAAAPKFPTKSASEKCKQAAAAVAGQYMTFKGITPYTPYYAISAGATANNQDINVANLSYLTSVDCSVDKNVSGYRTQKEYSSADVARKIKSAKGIDLTKISDKNKWFEVLERDSNGLYVKKVKVGTETYKGNTLHLSILGYSYLRSPCFWIEYDKARDVFKFTSLGYGTGVGMSQKGANEYAAQGYNYAWILQHFYPGVSITNR